MTILLVRHTEVAQCWRGRCYGASDAGLSRSGRAAIGPLVDALAQRPVTRIIHSDMARTRALAVPLARRCGVPLIADPRWRERGFGLWEGRPWTAIYRETGAAMDGMIEAPESFRPGGGETTHELGARAYAAWQALSSDGMTVVITHGGPIGALTGILNREPAASWHAHVPPYGGIITFRAFS